jgi:plastocyanin
MEPEDNNQVSNSRGDRKMSRGALLGAIAAAFVVVAILAGVALMNNDNDEPEPAVQNTTNNTTTQEPAPAQDNGQNAQPPASENEASVSIKDFAFSPASMTIKKGTTVTWTNEDDVAHTVTPDAQTPNFQGSGSLSQGESYSFTFDEAGTYDYHCQPHPNMTATVVVTD